MCVERESLSLWGVRPSLVTTVRTAAGSEAALAVGASGLLVLLRTGDFWRRVHCWRLEDVRVLDADAESVALELMADKAYSWRCESTDDKRELVRAISTVQISHRYDTHPDLEERELAALLEDTAPPLRDAELWARRLADTLQALDDSNLAAMLAAEDGTRALIDGLEQAADVGRAAEEARGRLEAAGGGGGAGFGPDGAPADRNARRLLAELRAVLTPLDTDTDARPELSVDEERLRIALQTAVALSRALRASGGVPWCSRLGAVRARRREVSRAADRLAASAARLLNDELLSLSARLGTEQEERGRARVLPLAPLSWWLRVRSRGSSRSLSEGYARAAARGLERRVRAACDAARAACPTLAGLSGDESADNPNLDAAIDEVLDAVEKSCDVEQQFCARMFFPDIEPPEEIEDVEGPDVPDVPEPTVGKPGPELSSLMNLAFPTLEQELSALLSHIDKNDPFGAMRLLSKTSARVLGGDGGGGGGRHSGAVLAAFAVACKRAADGTVAALLDEMRARPRDAVEELRRWAAGASGACRRAERERWSLALASAALQCAGSLTRPELRLAACHALHCLLSGPALRSDALAGTRREARARYERELRALARSASRVLEPLRSFLETAAETAARGVRREEVCFVSACSKQALRRVLGRSGDEAALRRALWREYRGAERSLPSDCGLLPVLWRAMQEEVIDTHRRLEEQLSLYYAGAGLKMPFSTRDILDIFSEIARQS